MRKLLKNSRDRRRGNAMLEFGFASLILIPLFIGTFQFGYTFYVYNLMNTQVRAASRYASLRSFRAGSSASIAKFKTAVANMVIYGNPAGTAPNLVPGLTSTNNVDVQIKDSSNQDADSTHVPATICVRINNFSVDAVLGSYSFNTKPVLTFPFQGQYLPAETE